MMPPSTSSSASAIIEHRRRPEADPDHVDAALGQARAPAPPPAPASSRARRGRPRPRRRRRAGPGCRSCGRAHRRRPRRASRRRCRECHIRAATVGWKRWLIQRLRSGTGGARAACVQSRRPSASRAALTRVASSAEPPASGWTSRDQAAVRVAYLLRGSRLSPTPSSARASAGGIAARPSLRCAATRARPAATRARQKEKLGHQPAIAAWRGAARRRLARAGRSRRSSRAAPAGRRYGRCRPRRSRWRSSRVRPLGNSSR